MKYDMYGDFETWIHDVGCDRVFRMWVFKKMFTPYEQQKCFSDESIYENAQCDFIKIREVIQISPDKIMLGVQKLYNFSDEEFEMTGENASIEYYMLDEIRLEYREKDMKEMLDDAYE